MRYKFRRINVRELSRDDGVNEKAERGVQRMVFRRNQP